MSASSRGQSNGEDSLDARIGRIINDFLDRKARGEAVTEADLYAAHPDIADELREALAALVEIRPPESEIEELVKRGVLAPPTNPKYLAELGPYKITGLVGRGGMGVVLSAYEESLERVVAVKLLRPDLAQDKIALARFKREAKAAAALQHPNIITIHAVGEHRGTHYLAMEYVNGPTLGDLIRDHGPLPAETIREVFRQILAGLAAAHEAGLIHRDIKPSNILLDRLGGNIPGDPAQTEQSERRSSFKEVAAAPRGGRGIPIDATTDPEASRAAEAEETPPAESAIRNPQSAIKRTTGCSPRGAKSAGHCDRLLVKITDFGLARMASAQTRLTMPESMLGTPEYMSPEQVRGDEDIDHRTDLYSAGVVLYEMLTGRTPFKADTPSAVIHQILHDEPPDPARPGDAVDPLLASRVFRLMAKDVADRFDSAFEVLAAQAAGERPFRPSKHRRLPQRALTSVVFIALASMGAWLIYWLVSPAHTSRITDVRVDPDVKTNIQVRYGQSGEWKLFHRFSDVTREITAADWVTSQRTGRQIVAAGLKWPLEGKQLFLFDVEQNARLGVDLADHRSWPDCDLQAKWCCVLLKATNLNNASSKIRTDLLVVARHLSYYPTRISIVDPDTGHCISTFWHMGHIKGLLVVNDFFDNGRAAICAWGNNNKLDGFGDPPPRPYVPEADSDLPLTDFDHVSVIMILDPQRMDGLGPPRTSRAPLNDIVPAIPWAYAFLDLPVDSGAEKLNSKPDSPKWASIVDVAEAAEDPEDQSGPWLAVKVQGINKSGERYTRCVLLVDRTLAVRAAREGSAAPSSPTALNLRRIFSEGVHVIEK